MLKKDIDTPALVICNKKLQKNLKKMAELAAKNGKHLRPHIKTHKSAEIARMQIDNGAIGVSAAKVTEALALAEKGIENILITSPVVTKAKIQNLLKCQKISSGIIVVCDSYENAKQLNSSAIMHDVKLSVLVDVDPGVGRTGVSHIDAINLSKFIHHECNGLSFRGIQSYAGNLQHITSYEERKRMSTNVMKKAADLRALLLKEGLPCDILTGSGTGTFEIDMDIEGITEVQPGSYTVMDVEYHDIGPRVRKLHHDAKCLIFVQN